MIGKLGRKGSLAAVAALTLALGVAACGAEEEEGHVVEGEPIELGDLRFNVQLTRFLNPNDVEDSEYLEGLPAPPLGEDYLGVFMEVENEGDGPATLPAEGDMKVLDTTGEEFEPIETETVFAFPFGLAGLARALPADPGGGREPAARARAHRRRPRRCRRARHLVALRKRLEEGHSALPAGPAAR